VPIDEPVPQSLAIVGASVRAAASSARRAGCEPIAADLFADQDLRHHAPTTRIEHYPAGLLDWLRAVRPPAWMYTGALENHPDLVDAMAGVSPLLGNGGDVLRRIRSPRELADTLTEAGLLFPETRDSVDDLPRDGSWLAKTYRGASGTGVRALVHPSPGLSVSLSPCLPLSLFPCLVFQRRVDGTPCAAVFVGANGRAALLGVTRQLVGEAWLGGGLFQYAGSIGPWPVTETARATIARIGDVLADRFALVGLFGVDLVVDGPCVWTVEINPRYTASVEIVERATGTSAVAAHLVACRRGWLGPNPWPATSTTGVLFGKAVLFAKRDVAIDGATAAWALREALVEPWPRLADVPAAGTHIAAGRPVMTVFAEGHDADNVLQQLRKRVADVERRLSGGGDSIPPGDRCG
jgi:predicted ATP-grasp superfamily ATP-dependent carboligase